MATHEVDNLEDLIAGRLPEAVAARVRAHLGGCPHCAGTLAGLSVEPLPESDGPQPEPSSIWGSDGAWRRLLHFTPRLSELFDLPEGDVEALLQTVDVQAEYAEGPAPGVWVRPVQGGPLRAEALCSLVRMESGATFPFHPHVGVEQVLVLQGAFREDGGREVWRGELALSTPDVAHDMTAFGGVDCLCAVVLQLD